MTVHGENDLEQKAWNWFGMPFEHFREPLCTLAKNWPRLIDEGGCWLPKGLNKCQFLASVQQVVRTC